jgi:hypothetical protein
MAKMVVDGKLTRNRTNRLVEVKLSIRSLETDRGMTRLKFEELGSAGEPCQTSPDGIICP